MDVVQGRIIRHKRDRSEVKLDRGAEFWKDRGLRVFPPARGGNEMRGVDRTAMVKLQSHQQAAPPGQLDPRSEELLEACPVCGGRRIGFFAWGKSRYRAQWYAYERCAECSLVFVNPRMPAGKHQARVESSGDAYRTFLRKAEFDRREFAFNMIGPVSRLLPPLSADGRPRRWLDIGCATGTLLDEASRRGYEAHGLELNKAKVEWMRTHLPHIQARQGLLCDLPQGSRYDVISADNVLEHIHEPAAFLAELQGFLAEDSLLVLRVPNYNNFLRPLLGLTGRLPRSFIMDPDAHPLNYSRRSLAALLGRSGFRIECVMEHLMVSYPLKHVLGELTKAWPAGLRQAAVALYPASFLFDRLIPRGGIDITVIARTSR